MAADQPEARLGNQPAGTGSKKETIRGALMAVGDMRQVRELARKLGMPALRWMKEGRFTQRAEFEECPRSKQLEQAIAASEAREWVTTHGMKWRFDVPRKRRRPSHENHRWPPQEPAAWPSVGLQRGAADTLSSGNAWRNPLRRTSPTVCPSSSSPEELRELIRTEVASLLAPYERWLREAKTEIAGKDEEIASLKAELAQLKTQTKLSAVPAADLPSPDPKCQQGTQERWQMQRSVRELKEAVQQCKALEAGHARRDREITVLRFELFALEKRLEEEQKLTREWRCTSPSPQAGAVHSLSEPLKEKGQNQQGNRHGWTDTAATFFRDEPEWPNPTRGFQYTTEVSGASASTRAFSFEDAANQQLPACASTGSFVFQQPVPAAVTPATSCPTTLKDGFVVSLSGSDPERTPGSDLGAVGKEVAAVLEARAALANTPPRAAAPRTRSKRQVSPGMHTAQAPAAKKGMVEDSEEEEDGTDADVRRWMEAEHMEAEIEEEDADEEVRGGLDPLMVYEAEEAKRPLTKQRSCLMGSEDIGGEEEARARRGPLFIDENVPMGG